MAITTTARRGHLGSELREAREARGLTRADLVQEIGCSLSHLQNIEGGAVPKQSVVVAELCRALGVKAPAQEKGVSRPS